MNKIDSLLTDIKKELHSEPCIQEYLRLKSILEKDEGLSNLDKEVKLHQRLMCENRNNKEVFEKEKALYEKASKEFDSNPVVINYKNVKEEVYALLEEIKGVLEA